MIVGDSNIYCLEFEGCEIRSDNCSESLLNIMNEFEVQRNVLRAAKRYQSNAHRTYQTLNLCSTAQDLTKRISTFEVRLDPAQNSDYFPISTRIDVTIGEVEPGHPTDGRTPYGQTFVSGPKGTGGLELEAVRLTSLGAIDGATVKLIQAIDRAIAAECSGRTSPRR